MGYSSASQVVGCDVMLEVERMTPGNSHTYIIFTDTDVISSEWGGGNDAFSLPKGSVANINLEAVGYRHTTPK